MARIVASGGLAGFLHPVFQRVIFRKEPEGNGREGVSLGRQSGLDRRFTGASASPLPFTISVVTPAGGPGGSRWMTSAIGSAIIESRRKGLESGDASHS